jgi:hypothetical protein
MRSITLILLLALVGLIGCAAEERSGFDFPTVIDGDFSVEPTGAVVPVNTENTAPAPLRIEEVEPTVALKALAQLGQTSCDRVGCVVNLRAFQYSSRNGAPEIDVVVDAVRAERATALPLQNDGATSWKLLDGEALSLEMHTLVAQSAAMFDGEAMELGRASCVYWPKSDVEVFAQVYVLHAPEAAGFVTVEILDVD